MFQEDPTWGLKLHHQKKTVGRKVERSRDRGGVHVGMGATPVSPMSVGKISTLSTMRVLIPAHGVHERGGGGRGRVAVSGVHSERLQRMVQRTVQRTAQRRWRKDKCAQTRVRGAVEREARSQVRQ